MSTSNLVWIHHTLVADLMVPQKVVPGTKMAYGGQHDHAQAAALADYLMSIK